jgi:hypothetical protein
VSELLPAPGAPRMIRRKVAGLIEEVEDRARRCVMEALVLVTLGEGKVGGASKLFGDPFAAIARVLRNEYVLQLDVAVDGVAAERFQLEEAVVFADVETVGRLVDTGCGRAQDAGFIAEKGVEAGGDIL